VKRAAVLLPLIAALFLATPAGAVTITELPLLADAPQPEGIAAGPDGNVWFAENRTAKVARVNPDTHKIEEFSDGVTPGSNPTDLTLGGDGNLWFAEEIGSKIGRITPGAKPTIKEFQGAGQPEGITFHNGELWLAEFGGSRIGTMTVNGTLAEQFFMGFTGIPMPFGITSGPDGNVWFTEDRFPDAGIARITEDGKITEFKAGLPAHSDPAGITTGPDGNLWFAEEHNNAVGKITPDGVITMFTLGDQVGSGPADVVVGPDKNIWFTGYDGSSGRYIGRITPVTGVITRYAKGVTGGPFDIALGPDGNLWFTERFDNRIGTVCLDPDVTTGLTGPPGQSSVEVAGTVDTIGTTTSYVVQYGTTTSYGSSTASRDLPADGSPSRVNVQLAGLQPGTLYHYRLVAANKQGTTFGDDRTFTTARGAATSGTGGGSRDTSGPKLVVATPSPAAAAPADDGAVTINIGCPLAETLGCRGSVTIDTVVPRRGGRAAALRRTRLGSARFTLGAGEKKAVKVRLSRTGRRIVHANHRLRVRVVVTARDHSGNRTTTVRALRL
jgi:streptogramin lyase